MTYPACGSCSCSFQSTVVFPGFPEVFRKEGWKEWKWKVSLEYCRLPPLRVIERLEIGPGQEPCSASWPGALPSVSHHWWVLAGATGAVFLVVLASDSDVGNFSVLFFFRGPRENWEGHPQVWPRRRMMDQHAFSLCKVRSCSRCIFGNKRHMCFSVELGALFSVWTSWPLIFARAWPKPARLGLDTR